MPTIRMLGSGLAPLGRLARAVLLVLAFTLAAQPAMANPNYAALVVDAKTGQTLFARNADAQRFPASLTKMMTLYLLFEELEAGRLDLDSRLSVSAYAAGRPPTKIGVRAGSTIRVEDAVRALAVRSANDVAAVVAENISGSVPAFAERMTRTARRIGMSRTTFRNPSGLPHQEQVTTARDMVLLAAALQGRFPQYFRYFGTRTWSYGGQTYRNTNRLLGAVAGMNGMKTGFIRASGFQLVANVERDGRHIIAVVMGGRTAASRNAHMAELINRHLPRASRGGRAAPLIAQFSVPQPPRSRPEPPRLAAERVPAQVAAAQPVPGAPLPLARPQGEGDADSNAEADPIGTRIAEAGEAAQMAYANGAGAEDDAIAKLEEIADGTRGAAAAKPEAEELPAGWHIQIGAVPSADGAQALLERAQSRAGEALASVDPFTQRVERDGAVFYRARFVGFPGGAEARAVCERLKRLSFACLALGN